MFSYLAILAVLLGCTLARDIRTETTCQTHKRNTVGQRALLHWDIQCDAQGLYLPLQCTVETPKWCACYNKENSITQPSRGTKSCECHLAKDEAIRGNKPQCETPECDRSGKFLKRQCCNRENKCRCVDPTTGQTTVQPTANMNLQCP